ncbi:hypothetical protein ACFQZC_38400 [Streptacidiphilus monticola]
MKGLLWAPRPGIASRDTVRRAATLTGTLAVFVLTTAQVACAATASSSTGSRAGGGGGAGILGPFNVTSSEGVPLDHYDLVSNSGGLTDFQQEAQSYLMSMLWALSRTLVGLECWLIHWAYSFPLVTAVSTQAQQLADGYRTYVVDALGLPGLLLAWAVVVGGIMLLRGRAGRALGELLLTFVIAGVAASALVRPDVILGPGGLLDQTKQASTEVAAITANHGTPPSTVAAADAGQVSAPIQHTLTDVFVVQTWQLLEFGHPHSQGPRLDRLPAGRHPRTPYSQDSESQTDDCAGLTGTGLDLCRAQATASGDGKPEDNLAHLFAKDQATAAYLKTPPGTGCSGRCWCWSPSPSSACSSRRCASSCSRRSSPTPPSPPAPIRCWCGRNCPVPTAGCCGGGADRSWPPRWPWPRPPCSSRCSAPP